MPVSSNPVIVVESPIAATKRVPLILPCCAILSVSVSILFTTTMYLCVFCVWDIVDCYTLTLLVAIEYAPNLLLETGGVGRLSFLIKQIYINY